MQERSVCRRCNQRIAVLLTFLILVIAQSIQAQTSISKVEVGGQIAVIDLRDALHEKPPGVGGRFSYNITDQIAFEAEVNYFSTPEADLSRTQGLFGVKIGKRLGKPSIGLFAKARPGFLRFHGERRPGISINGVTKFALDLGGVLELYPARRVILRIDLGDTVIFYNGETIRRVSLPGGPQQRLDAGHSLQASIGIGFRF